MAKKRKKITHLKEFIVSQLTAPEKQQLAAICLKIYEQFFEYPNQDYYLNKSLFPESLDTRVFLYFDKDNVVGYSTVYFLKVTSGIRPIIIGRASAFSLLEYKVDTSLMKLGLKIIFRVKLRWPLSQLYYCATANSPAVYALFTRSFSQVYPQAKTFYLPQKIETLRNQTCQQFGFKQVDKTGWVVAPPSQLKNIHNLKHKKSIQQNPWAQYYMDLNPEFAKGRAVYVMIPIHTLNVLGFIKNTLKQSLKSALMK